MDELKPCPICGRKVIGNRFGGLDKFGCDEFTAEIECFCGLSFCIHCVGEETWKEELAKEWNKRSEEFDRQKLIELANELDRVQRTLVTGAYMEPMEAAVRIRKALGMVE